MLVRPRTNIVEKRVRGSMYRECGGEISERLVESVNGGWRGECYCLTVDEGVG